MVQKPEPDIQNMKIKLKNLGALRQAEFELGDLTIICGQNNTGKTYATYALFGFLTYWRDLFTIELPGKLIDNLLNEGHADLQLEPYMSEANAILENGCNAYTKQLPTIFAASQKNFELSEFCVTFDSADLQLMPVFERNIGSAKMQIFTISKKENDTKISITLLIEKEQVKIPQNIIVRAVSDAVKEIIFGHLFPNPFIASAERTGAAIFRKELNFSRNRLLEQISTEKDLNPIELLTKVYSDYALPVKSNVDFTRQLEGIAKEESFIAKEYPEILQDFATIIGGEYVVTKNDELYYSPVGKRIKLTMDESSSAVRSLLDIGFYIRHVAKRGDLLMVDEPELNLHPENQRKVARLFARLMNVGIKVFITTHSDYIIKELNTLIMLNQDKAYLKEIALREGYVQQEFISAKKIKVFIAENAPINVDGCVRKVNSPTLVSANISPEYGIEARSFDVTIDTMNRIQEEIVWGGK
jgi:predicted ATPase